MSGAAAARVVICQGQRGRSPRSWLLGAGRPGRLPRRSLARGPASAPRCGLATAAAAGSRADAVAAGGGVPLRLLSRRCPPLLLRRRRHRRRRWRRRLGAGRPGLLPRRSLARGPAEDPATAAAAGGGANADAALDGPGGLARAGPAGRSGVGRAGRRAVGGWVSAVRVRARPRRRPAERRRGRLRRPPA